MLINIVLLLCGWLHRNVTTGLLYTDSRNFLEGGMLLAGVCAPFHHHTELAYQIKVALNSKTREDPQVRIKIAFDYYLFTGGLQQLGKKHRQQRGHTIYGITLYGSLAPLLGDQWHIRVLNDCMKCQVRDCAVSPPSPQSCTRLSLLLLSDYQRLLATH